MELMSRKIFHVQRFNIIVQDIMFNIKNQ